MDILNSIIQTTLESFDFSFCITVNILTYFIVKIADELNGEAKVNTWIKRGILIVVISLMGGYTIYNEKLEC